MTKKAINEALKAAPKFIVYIDYTAACGKGTEIKALSASDILSAMDEAEHLKDSNVYLMRIAESTGKVDKYNNLLYIDRLCTRYANWYLNDKKHGENIVEYTYDLEYKYFEWNRVLEEA